MVIFTLRCGGGHLFEGWFRSLQDYEAQRDRNLVSCPECGSLEIEKRPCAPQVARGVSRRPAAEVQAQSPQGATARSSEPSPAHRRRHAEVAQAMGVEREMVSLIRNLRAEVEKHCDYVGPRFAEEARRIHYGETEPHGIYGEASREEARALIEEGIEIVPLPGIRKTDA